MIYDGACAFCRRWVARFRARTGTRVLYLPRQTPLVPRLLGVSSRAARRSMQLREPGGQIHQGAEAVFRVLGRAPRLAVPARLARLPVVRAVAEWVYRRIANHRVLAARVDRVLFGTATTPPRSALVRSLFVRALGVTWLAAFSSLSVQVLGLYGRRGVVPMEELFEGASALPGRRRLRLLPSVFWLDASDEALVRACRLGQLLSLALVIGVAPRLVLAALWALYLSFVTAGSDFLSFQWDALLLETSLYAMVIAPSGVLPTLRREEPPWQAVLLMRWLAFRFFYEAGIAKLRSGDETWRARTACVYHYETQPLPTPLGWQAHHLPRAVQRLSTSVALGTEVFVPFLAFAPRRLRRLGFGGLAFLQGAIAATGNYGFFNLSALTLSLWLLDDEPLLRWSRAVPREAPEPTRGVRRWAIAAGALVLFAASATMHLVRFGRRRPPRAMLRLATPLAQMHSVNAYGLFASMTVQRPEIVIEGSDDGATWLEYSFRYKPGDPNARPRWVAPHMPRLDWQMWFAALGGPPTWFFRLLQRLLEGSPEVLDLLERTPFPDHPPRYARAVLYDYKMTDRETRRTTNAYWTRQRLGLYVPPVTLPQ